VPALLSERDVRRDRRLVVAERLQRIANPRRRVPLELLDAPARRVARLLVEVEVREHVRREWGVQTQDFDFCRRDAGNSERRGCRHAKAQSPEVSAA
jgi:hypothetical protein